MVVRRDRLFGNKGERFFTGFRRAKDIDLNEIIKSNHTFLPRDEVEHNPAYKQIIPYVLFLTPEKKIFLYRRLKNSSEERLHEKYSIGIGGHINPADGNACDALVAGMKRELEEEVEHDGMTHKLCGFLNLEQTSVDKVHFGAVFVVKGRNIKVRESKTMEGRLVSIDEAAKVYEKMEDWSKVIYDALIRGEIDA
mgnify:CR=1 FL=1